MSAIPRTGCSAVKHVSIAKPATSEDENLPGCSGSNGFDITEGLEITIAGLGDLGNEGMWRCGLICLRGTHKGPHEKDHHIMTNTPADEKSQQEWSRCE